MTSLSLEDSLLVDDGLIQKSLTTLATTSFVGASLDDLFLNDFDNFLTNDADFAFRSSTLNDTSLNDLNDFDLAFDHFRLGARLALNHLLLDDLASGNLNQFDTLLSVAFFLVETFQGNFLDRNALFDGDDAVRFVEWREKARLRFTPTEVALMDVE